MTPNGMHRQHAVEYNTVVLGSPGVGKSSMIQRFITGTFSRGYTPTIEQKYKKEMSIDGKIYSLVVLDTMGHEDRGPILDAYTLEQHGVLVVFDLSNEHSFKIAEELAEKLSSRLSEEPIILVGNKSDQERVIDQEEAQRVVDDYGLREYTECSASEDQNSINSVFDLLIEQIIEDKEEEEKNYNTEIDVMYSGNRRTMERNNQTQSNIRHQHSSQASTTRRQASNQVRRTSPENQSSNTTTQQRSSPASRGARAGSQNAQNGGPNSECAMM